MVIGTYVIDDNALHPRISVNLSTTLAVKHYAQKEKWLKPSVGIELDVPADVDPEDFMDCMEQFVLGKLSQYLDDLDKWSTK